MQIRMKTTAAGPDGCLQSGKVYDLPVDQAKVFLAGGYAEAVDRQVATRSAPENAASSTGKLGEASGGKGEANGNGKGNGKGKAKDE